MNGRHILRLGLRHILLGLRHILRLEIRHILRLEIRRILFAFAVLEVIGQLLDLVVELLLHDDALGCPLALHFEFLHR